MLKPTSSPLRRAALAAAVLGSLAAPGAAAQAAPSEATYSVTFRGEMTDKWHAMERFTDNCKLTGAMCVRDMKGEGAVKLNITTRRPTKVLVFRGLRGKPPTISMGATPGIPVTGSALRTGSLSTEYSGPWDAANPDQKAPDSGCGRRSEKGYVTFNWRARNQLGIIPTVRPDPEDCPNGPGRGVDVAERRVALGAGRRRADRRDEVPAHAPVHGQRQEDEERRHPGGSRGRPARHVRPGRLAFGHLGMGGHVPDGRRAQEEAPPLARTHQGSGP